MIRVIPHISKCKFAFKYPFVTHYNKTIHCTIMLIVFLEKIDRVITMSHWILEKIKALYHDWTVLCDYRRLSVTRWSHKLLVQRSSRLHFRLRLFCRKDVWPLYTGKDMHLLDSHKKHGSVISQWLSRVTPNERRRYICNVRCICNVFSHCFSRLGPVVDKKRMLCR